MARPGLWCWGWSFGHTFFVVMAQLDAVEGVRLQPDPVRLSRADVATVRCVLHAAVLGRYLRGLSEGYLRRVRECLLPDSGAADISFGQLVQVDCAIHASLSGLAGCQLFSSAAAIKYHLCKQVPSVPTHHTSFSVNEAGMCTIPRGCFHLA